MTMNYLYQIAHLIIESHDIKKTNKNYPFETKHTPLDSKKIDTFIITKIEWFCGRLKYLETFVTSYV